MGWKIFDEAVEMLARQFQYFPRAFRWRGRRYGVNVVERCWTVSRSGWRQRVERRYFQVQCNEGCFELFQDLGTGTWHLRRARLAVVPVSRVQRVAPAWR
jgi:hypothetical protein